MTIRNTQYHHNLAFDEYQALPGMSFSAIRSGGRDFAPTERMKLGSLTHQYLLEPDKFTGNLRTVKPLAMALKSVVGELWDKLLMEVSVTCEMEYEGLVMLYRGRIDECIKERIVIDFKVAERIRHSMEFFGYKNQISGYCLSTGADMGFIIAINPREYRPKADIIPVKPDAGWWQAQVLKFGEAVV